MVTRIAIQTEYRAAAVALLKNYAAVGLAGTGTGLQIYRARPATIRPPTAFVEGMGETVVDFLAPNVRQRTPSVLIRLVWGLFDSGTAVDQRDAFVDGFSDWVTDNYHAAGANTLIAVARLTDDPTWVPDWLPQEQQKTYYSTLVTLEGQPVGT